LAYSGGLDTTVILPGLKTEKIGDAIAFCADLGEGENLPDIKRKAVQAGSSKVNVEDLL
jgi:argininosuccinate synthase